MINQTPHSFCLNVCLVLSLSSVIFFVLQRRLSYRPSTIFLPILLVWYTMNIQASTGKETSLMIFSNNWLSSLTRRDHTIGRSLAHPLLEE